MPRHQPTSSFSTLSLFVRSRLLVLSCETVSSSRAIVCSLSSKSRRSFSFVPENIWTFLSSCCSLIRRYTQATHLLLTLSMRTNVTPSFITAQLLVKLTSKQMWISKYLTLNLCNTTVYGEVSCPTWHNDRSLEMSLTTYGFIGYTTEMNNEHRKTHPSTVIFYYGCTKITMTGSVYWPICVKGKGKGT